MIIITIGFSKSRKKFPILSWIIMIVEKSKFSHTYVKVKIADRELVYQASGRTVHFSNMEEFNIDHEVIFEREITIPKYKYAWILQFCFDNLNKPYSVLQLLGILFCKFFKIRNPFANKSEGFICSEISYLIAKSVLDQISADQDAVTPEDLYEILKKIDII